MISEENRIEEEIKRIIPKIFRASDIRKTIPDIQLFAKNYEKGGRGLYLYGPAGVGKTYSACAIAIELIKEDVEIDFYNLLNLLQEMREKISRSENDYRFLEHLKKVEVLFIDDIGTEKSSDWVTEFLYNLINSRYENIKTTIFTSNLELDELADRVDDKLASRISQMAYIMKCTGADRRNQIKIKKI